MASSTLWSLGKIYLLKHRQIITTHPPTCYINYKNWDMSCVLNKQTNAFYDIYQDDAVAITQHTTLAIPEYSMGV